MRDLAFLAFWVALLPIALRGAHLGVMLWAWTSLLGPNDMLYGIGTMVPFAKVAAIPTLLLLVFGRRGDVQFRFGRTGGLLIALAVLALVSENNTIMDDHAAGWDLCEKYLKVLALGLAVLWTMTDRLRVHGLIMAICLGVGFIAIDEGVKFILSGSGHKVLGSPSTGDNNQVALDVLMIIPLLQYLHASARSPGLRLVCLATGLLGVVTVIATYSRGGALGLAIVAVASVLTSRRKGLGLVALSVGILVAASLIGTDWVDRMDTVQNASEDSSFMGRVVAWKVSTALAIQRPFTGGGFHAIQHPEVWASQAGNFLGLDFIQTPPQGSFARAAHSIYFEVLGDLGFVGLALFVLLLVGAWRDAGAIAGIVRRSRRADLAWAADLAGKLRVSLLAFMISGALLSAAYYDIDYLIVCLLAALREIVRRHVKMPDVLAMPRAVTPARRQALSPAEPSPVG